jgi:hypothetical protein
MDARLSHARRAGDRLRVMTPAADEADEAAQLRVWDNFQRIERDALAPHDRRAGDKLRLSSAGDEEPPGLGVWDNFQRLEREATAAPANERPTRPA